MNGCEPIYIIRGFEFEARGLTMEIYAMAEDEAESIAAIHRKESSFDWKRNGKKPTCYLTDVAPIDLFFSQKDEAKRKLKYRKERNI